MSDATLEKHVFLGGSDGKGKKKKITAKSSILVRRKKKPILLETTRHFGRSQAAAITGGSGSSPPLAGRLWATGLPWSSGESSEGGAMGVAEAAATASFAEFITRLDFLLDFDVPSSPPDRFFFFGRSAEGRSSSEVAV